MITAKEMREVEAKSGVSISTLMGNAGYAIAKILSKKYDLKGKKILVVCYHGNNGGDGFAAANNLYDKCEVDILFLGDENKLGKEALTNYKKVKDNNKIQFVNFDIDFDIYDIILDAILGTGISGKLREPIRNVIERINESRSTKVSVDIPSGMNPDSGEVADIAVNPDFVIALHDMKKGAAHLEDKTIIVDIGIKVDQKSNFQII